LLEFDQNGKPKANYSETSLGNLHSVDVSNPLKILLFYPDFAQMQLLDSKLTLQSSIYLRNFNIIQPVAVCQSNAGGYWVFDLQDYQLKKIDLNLQLQYQSGNLNQTLGYTLFPNFIIEWEGKVYMNNPSTGILVFDQFGSYMKTIAVTGLKNFQIMNTDLIYTKENKCMRFDTKTFSENEILLPVHDSLVSTRFEQHQLYLLTTASLNFYSY